MKYTIEIDDLGKCVAVGKNKLYLHPDRIEVKYEGDIIDVKHYNIPVITKGEKLAVLQDLINYYHDIEVEALPF